MTNQSPLTEAGITVFIGGILGALYNALSGYYSVAALVNGFLVGAIIVGAATVLAKVLVPFVSKKP